MPDYTVGDTVYKRFTTRSFATGAPATLAGTPVVSAYEDDSAVQITAGITLGVDHDTVTGLNLLTIVATGANGYEAGKSYDLVITTGTVGGVSVVGEVVWHFTLSAEAAAVDLANGTDGLGAIKADTAAILTDTGTTLDNLVDDLESRLGTPSDLGGGATVAANLSDLAGATFATATDSQEAIANALATVDGNVDAILVDTGTTLQAELDGIQADTENIQSRLPAALSAAGNMKADVQEVNATAVGGTGAEGDEWGPA